MFTTGHQLSSIHYDQKFVNSTFRILLRHNLTPIDPDSWDRPCWHSNYGFCLTEKNNIVFVKIFKPHLGSNAQNEVSAREQLAYFHCDFIYFPPIISFIPNDLCLVLEPVQGICLSELMDTGNYFEPLARLTEALLDIRVKSLSNHAINVQEWTDKQFSKYFDKLSGVHLPSTIHTYVRNSSNIISNSSNNNSALALGDVTPWHLFWHEETKKLSYIDLETAGTRPDFYDVAFFCHRLLTHSTFIRFKQAYEIMKSFLQSVEQKLDTVEVIQFRQLTLTLLQLRLLGGTIDRWIIGNNTNVKSHVLSWRVLREMLDKLD